MNIKDKITRKALKDIEKITDGKLTLGKFLWAIRKCDKISPTNFANKLGISKQHLCDLEHGRKNVSSQLAAYYAEALGYSKEQFVQLALQDLVDHQGLKVRIEVKPKLTYAHSCAQKS